jgi:hypothetical protein
MTIAEKMFKRMLKLWKQGDDMESGGAEAIIRDSKECIAIIWAHNGEDGTPEDSEECDGHWLDVFTDGSAIECCPRRLRECAYRRRDQAGCWTLGGLQGNQKPNQGDHINTRTFCPNGGIRE